MNKNKIKIVEVDLDIDVEEEIMKHTSKVSESVRERTEQLIKSAKMKKIKVDRKKTQKEKDRQWLASVVEIMQKEKISAKQLLKISESQNLSAVILKLKSHLKKEYRGRWVLLINKKQGERHYSLAPFADPDE